MHVTICPVRAEAIPAENGPVSFVRLFEAGSSREDGLVAFTGPGHAEKARRVADAINMTTADEIVGGQMEAAE